MELNELQKVYLDFIKKREWEEFHTPKNLVMALSSEVGELTDLFLWSNSKDSYQILSTARSEKVKEELGDVFLYLIRLAQVLDVDLVDLGHRKLAKNALKYPVDLSRGNAQKYTELGLDQGSN